MTLNDIYEFVTDVWNALFEAFQRLNDTFEEDEDDTEPIITHY